MVKVIAALLMIVMSPVLLAQNLCVSVQGATVIADDGSYLGKVENRYSADSIFNEYGTYGSRYSAESIWNTYGTYGSEYSTQSPFNRYTSTPPVLVKGGRVIGYLTVNNNIRGAINPHYLRSCDF